MTSHLKLLAKIMRLPHTGRVHLGFFFYLAIKESITKKSQNIFLTYLYILVSKIFLKQTRIYLN